MARITLTKTREIVDNFAEEIKKKMIKKGKPSLHVINFRGEMREGKERPVVKVPIDCLRYRMENGRISSDVLDYMKNVGPLDEKDDDSQAIIRGFLKRKDPEKTAVLRKSIIHDGQREPAIITCDGFLINGNRRKMVMELLHKEFPGDDRFQYMKVVILPGKGDEGDSPTLVEIEQIENRYQLQHSGKSEYYGFDRALSIKRKIKIGLSLKEQLQDDPVYVDTTAVQLNKAVKKFEKDYLQPLSRIDQYLNQFKREGEYRTISSGMADPEGRWQAFKDYSDKYYGIFRNPHKLSELGIGDDEVGAIEEAAFNIIRLRIIKDMPKVHLIMRDLPKYCSTKDGKKEIMKIADDVEPVLPTSEQYDESENPLSSEEIDERWASKYKRQITYHVKKASKIQKEKKEKETPLELLEAAFKKLTHDDMDLTKINLSDHPKARKIVVEIGKCAEQMERDLYEYKKALEKFKKKK